MTEVMNPPLPGKVPEHWKALRLKHWIGINESVLPESTDPGFEFRYMEISAVDHGRLIEFPQKTHFEVAPSRARRRVKLGDTLLSTVRTYLKAIWYAENLGDDLVCSTGFAVLTPKKGTNPKYVNYLVQSEPFTDRITVESVGTAYPAISENKLASFEVRVPPPDGQAAIVRYLDDADQRIRAYVSAKERLIALLEEERQAVIHQAVTQGLDPNVRLTPSGVEWLRDVPEHWQMERGKQLLKKTERPVSEDDEVVTCFRDGEVTLRKNRRTEGFTESLKEIGYQGIKKGDLVIHGMDAFAGSVGVSDSDGKGTPVYSVCETASNANAYYYALVIREMARNQWILALAKGIRERSTDFRYTTLAAEKLPLPPITNQTAIVKYLDKVTADTDATVDRARRQVELMEEYHTRLIADVVTGKIDVTVTQARGGAWTESLIPANQAEVETACE